MKLFSSLKVALVALAILVTSIAIGQGYFFADDADVPPFAAAKAGFDKEAYMLARSQYVGQLRGIEENKPFDPQLRIQAMNEMQTQMQEIAARGAPPAIWVPLGPAPIPNGQTLTITTAVSGRVIAIAVHPTNANIVYVGTANGGLYRSTDGGTNWTPLMDNALSMAIGAIAIAPSQPDTLYIGTGEHTFSSSSFFGVGVYRITNASTATPTVTGPFNQDVGTADVFTGRGISRILVHPTNPNTIFVATTSGIAGIGAVANPSLPSRGIYRSTNAGAGSPVFAKLTGLASNANSSVRDISFDPLNPDLMVANVVASGGIGGIYTTSDALAAAPVFAQTTVFNSTGTSELTAEFAVHHTNIANPPTFYAATGNLGGRVLRSVDSGVTWVEQIDNDFCTPQCFYNIAIGVNPTNADNLFIGGGPTSGGIPFAYSTNGGTSFTASHAGLHVDSHVIAVAPSLPTTVYFGSDGGIYKSVDSGVTWIVLNNSQFSATQFMGLDTHPRDAQYMIGGTQDNGTNMLRPNSTWNRVDFGDGGFAAIDQNATDSTTVRMYHTYFNAATLMGYSTVATTAAASDGNWTFRGCQAANTTVNGITCSGGILFYAPLVRGPGSPNTIYYGSDRLYRTNDFGVTHTTVSQAPLIAGAPSVPISAIGIAGNDDNVRVVGMNNGGLFRTTTGSATMDVLDPIGAGSVIPDLYISRIVIDKNNNNIVYIALAAYPGAGLSVWKSSNFLSATPTFTASGSGLPSVPTNALAIDPSNSSRIYAGTDIGVYESNNAGGSWSPVGTGMPRVPVFGLAFQAAELVPVGRLRAATHGRGIYELVAVDTGLIFANSFE